MNEGGLEKMEFKLPAGVQAATIDLEECTNCHGLTPTAELAKGVCQDCREISDRVHAYEAQPPAAEPFQLIVGVDDDTATRREIRKAVAAGAERNPQGWLQHATEQVRKECVTGRSGHTFTIDTILDLMEAAGVPMPPQPASMRFVMEQAITRGWCEATDRTVTGHRAGETADKPIRVYASKL